MAKFSEHLNKDIADVKTSAEWDGSKWINKVKAQEIEDALATLLTKAGFDAKADVTLSALRDALRGTGSKTLSDLATALGTLNSKDFATQTTLAAILNKIIAAPATEAKQTSIESKIDTIDSVLDGIAAEDFATELTLNEISNYIYSLLQQAATEDKQDALIAKDFATQTTLAAILAKIIEAPATEAKQTALAALIGEVQASPTANTLLARLKSLEDKIGTIDGVLDAIVDGSAPAATQLTGSIPEYNWFVTDGRPTPKETTKPAIGVEVDADTGNMVGLLWNGTNWKEV